MDKHSLGANGAQKFWSKPRLDKLGTIPDVAGRFAFEAVQGFLRS